MNCTPSILLFVLNENTKSNDYNEHNCWVVFIAWAALWILTNTIRYNGNVANIETWMSISIICAGLWPEMNVLTWYISDDWTENCPPSSTDYKICVKYLTTLFITMTSGAVMKYKWQSVDDNSTAVTSILWPNNAGIYWANDPITEWNDTQYWIYEVRMLLT